MADRTRLYFHPHYPPPFNDFDALSLRAPKYLVEHRGEFYEVTNGSGWDFRRKYTGSTLGLRQVVGRDEGFLRIVLHVPEYA